jgi:hypothetical protein
MNSPHWMIGTGPSKHHPTYPVELNAGLNQRQAEVFCFFDNDECGYAVRDTLDLQEMLKSGNYERRFSMKNRSWKTKLLYFVLGSMCVLGILILTGAKEMRYGGYQISSWAADSVGFGCYITDTNTGITKVVYQNTGGDDPIINNLNKPFDQY